MKTIKRICFAFIVLAFSTSCGSGIDGVPEKDTREEARLAKWEWYVNNYGVETGNKSTSKKDSKSISKRDEAISYLGKICSDEPIFGKSEFTSTRLNASLWDYYSFEAKEGDVISISVLRVSLGMDPAAILFFGTTDSSADIDVYDYEDSGDNLEYISDADDEISNESCFGDPFFDNITLPYTGTYTLVVYSYANCGEPPYEYVIHAEGISCDSDDDGFNNDVDEHPYSVKTENILFHNTDTGVKNLHIGKGTFMADLIKDVLDDIKDNNSRASLRTKHRIFERWINTYSREWAVARLITTEERYLLDRMSMEVPDELFDVEL